MTSCGTDYVGDNWTDKSYILVYSIFVYYTPLITIIVCYYHIVSVRKNLITLYFRNSFYNMILRKAVAAHERGMREQAKKMNVASLRSGEQGGEKAEHKLAKVWYTKIYELYITINKSTWWNFIKLMNFQVALTTISLWFMAWTPYLVTNYVGIFSKQYITPLATIWASLFAKTNACYNPIVYAFR